MTHNVVRGDGQGRVNLEFVRRLLKRGFEVEIFADRVDQDLLEAGASWTPIHPGFQSVDLLKVWRFRTIADRVLAKRAHEFSAIVACGVVLSIEHDLNVAHFVHGTWLRSPWHASRVRGGIDGAYQWLFTRLNARWELQVFEQAEVVGAVSRMVADELAEIGVDNDKIVVLGNGVDVDEFKPGPEPRRELGLPDGVPLGLFVGDIRSPIKNLDAVLRAMVAVPEMHLAVAGRRAGSPYPAMAEELGIGDRVHFLDFRRDVGPLMRATDFFVLVSRRDSCPLVVLEAIASGLPVVTARTVGNHDLVEECCGFVIETPDSIDELAEALRVLTSDTELRTSWSTNARNRAMGYSWDDMSDRYVGALGPAIAEARISALR